jgi:SAM-dependent methyltransferase
LQKKKRKPFDKYLYYFLSVQSPESDVSFMHDTYRKLRGKKPKTLREDFCAAFANCCEWVKQGSSYSSYGIDIDEEPIAYGYKHYLPEITKSQQKRVHILQKNVLDSKLPSADIACALNFSYFCFKERSVLLKYFRNTFKTLKKDGIFVIDCFGGTNCQEQNVEETVHEEHGFSYFWDQGFFDPVTNHCEFAIHFKRKREKMRRNVFTYDWRMWTIPELKDLLQEAGFKTSTVYWEGTTRNGEGNGVFKATEVGEECESWISYIVAEK